MADLLTTGEVARAIQVSESSVKRWCGRGVLAAQYTAGGHRRIPVRELVKFLKSSQRTLVQPELIGWPAATTPRHRGLDLAAADWTEALLQGDREQCRRIALGLYLARHRLSTICDTVLAKSLDSIGRRWEEGAAEVFRERRACEITQRVLYELWSLIDVPPHDAPLAMGGTTEGDHYSLATTMIELVLRDAGWNAVSLGSHLPFGTLSSAIRTHRPRMFWLSCSHISDEAQFLGGYAALYDQFGRDVSFVVGGRALSEPLRRQMDFATYGRTLGELEAFAKTLFKAG